jgi:aspartokinase
MKTQASKAMEKLRDENIVIKLWHQFAINIFLVVHLSKLMKLA